MNRVPILLALMLVPALASSPGCNGGSKGGKSLSQQFQDAQKVTDANQRARRMAQLAEKQHQSGDVLGAGTSLSGAREAAQSVKDPASKARALIYVAGYFAKLGESSEDIKFLLKEATLATKEIPDADVRVPVLAELASATGTHLKNPDLAISHLKTAEEAAAALERPVPKVTALTKIAVAYEKLGHAEEAGKVIAAAKEFAAGLTKPRERCDCLAELAVALAKMKRTEEAAAALDDAQKAADEITEDDNRAYALLNLAEKSKAAGKKDLANTLLAKATDIAEKVTDTSIRGPLLDEIDATRKNL